MKPLGINTSWVASAMAPYVEWVVCDLCGSTNQALIYPATFTERDFSLNRFRSFTYANSDTARGHIVRCCQCGLVYMNPRDRDVASLYQEVDDAYYFSSAADRMVSFYHDLEKIEQIVPHGDSRRLLDVGCSYGFFLDVAHERGWQVWGSELSKKQAAHAAERHPTVCNRPVRECNFAPDFFDVITAFDVLEHVPSPRQFLKELYPVLKPGGHLVLTTPDITSWPAKVMGRYWLNFVRMHLYYFSPAAVTRLLAEEGFSVVAIRRHYRIITIGVAIEWMKKHLFIYYLLQAVCSNRLVKNWRLRCGLSGNMTVYARKIPNTNITQPFLSVIIPAYNEERRIIPTLESVCYYLALQPWPSEVIVVSDGSVDRTVVIVESFKKRFPTVQILENKLNHGKGYAVRQGMLAAHGRLCLFMDADSSTPIEEFGVLLPYIKSDNQRKVTGLEESRHDIVIGSLAVAGARIDKRQFILRVVAGKLGNWVIQAFLALDIKDTQRGFKLFTAQAVEKIFPLLTIERWGFDIEILALARRLGFSIKEVPVQWSHNPLSKISAWAYVEVLGEVFKIVWRLRRLAFREVMHRPH